MTLTLRKRTLRTRVRIWRGHYKIARRYTGRLGAAKIAWQFLALTKWPPEDVAARFNAMMAEVIEEEANA
jgi:hypothetical protein